MGEYRLLSHTADIMVEVKADSVEQLFAAAARALGSIIYDRRLVRVESERRVDVQGYDLEDLLYNFLRSVFSLFSIDSFLWRYVDVRIKNEGRGYELSGKLAGEGFVFGKHRIKEEVKAITYHRLAVEKQNGGFRATFIVDV